MTDITDDLFNALEQRAQQIRDERQAAAEAAAVPTRTMTWLETALTNANNNDDNNQEL